MKSTWESAHEQCFGFQDFFFLSNKMSTLIDKVLNKVSFKVKKVYFRIEISPKETFAFF